MYLLCGVFVLRPRKDIPIEWFVEIETIAVKSFHFRDDIKKGCQSQINSLLFVLYLIVIAKEPQRVTQSLSKWTSFLYEYPVLLIENIAPYFENIFTNHKIK